jgi:anti-repressor protein
MVASLAKILRQNGIKTGQNRLFKWLRENDYLIKYERQNFNTPTQKAMDLDLFKIEEVIRMKMRPTFMWAIPRQ